MDLKNPTRSEALLANIAGHTNVPIPELKNPTRTELLLKEILDNGGGGGGGGDVTKAYVDEQIADVRGDIPTNTSDLTNDSGFLTSTAAASTYEPKVIDITQAEYDALEEYEDDVFYNITDADPSGITVDSALSATSENPVQNKAIMSQMTIFTRGQAKQNAIANRTYQGEALTDLFAHEIQADYDNAWQWITARTNADNFDGINVADFIPMTIKTYNLNAQIAGINTYKNYGDSAVGAHIDFICKELWPTLHPVNKVNYNNGTSAQNHPWLASDLYLYLNSLSGDVPNGTGLNPETVAVDYTADGVYYFLPTQLKNVIIEKKFLLPTRYSASGLLTDDNSWAWKNIGKLWLPDECEVYGMPVWGGKGGYSLGGSGLQYPLFAGNMNRLKFRNGSRGIWWLLSPSSGNSTNWCYVNSYGHCSSYDASNSGIAAPVCFRTGTTYTA